jgi:putative ABC transport system permease protein
VRPEIGRAILPRDDVPGAPGVVVLGHRLWARSFGADPAAVGRIVRLDGAPLTVVGVMPEALDAVVGAREFWTPLALGRGQDANFTPYLSLLGRLADGATPASVARELDAIVARLGAPAKVEGAVPTARVLPIGGYLVRDYRRPLLVMLAAVGVVLCIACANVATLVLARSVGRSREFALRSALGAGRGRLVRQLVAEQLILGLLATAVACPVAAITARALAAAVPADVPRLAAVGFGGRAFAVAILLGCLTTLVCGLAPALQAGQLDVRSALQAGGRGSTGVRGERWRRWMVSGEVALTMVLLTSAGLLVRSALALGRVQPGFDLAHVLTARLALPERDYPELPRAVSAYAAILDAARRQPGIASAALVSRVPLGGSMTSIDLALADRPLVRANTLSAALRITSPDYFRSMGIPLVAGRDLRPADDEHAAPVIVVNETLARRLGGRAAAVGRRVRSDNSAFADGAGKPREMEIVGVVGDVRDGGPRVAAAAEFYAPLGQIGEEPWNYWISRELVLVARTVGPAAGAAPALRRAVASVDPTVPLYDVQSTDARLDGALAVERLSTRLLAVLGVLGLLLAAIGIHGVIAYVAQQRAREVAIRLALGASAAHAVGLVVRQGMRPVLVGLVLGGAGSAVVGRAAGSLLFEIPALDPVSVLASVALLAAVAALASLGPALRTTRVDPATALTSD